MPRDGSQGGKGQFAAPQRAAARRCKTVPGVRCGVSGTSRRSNGRAGTLGPRGGAAARRTPCPPHPPPACMWRGECGSGRGLLASLLHTPESSLPAPATASAGPRRCGHAPSGARGGWGQAACPSRRCCAAMYCCPGRIGLLGHPGAHAGRLAAARRGGRGSRLWQPASLCCVCSAVAASWPGQGGGGCHTPQ